MVPLLLAGCVDREPASPATTAAALLSSPEVEPTGVVREFDRWVRADYEWPIAGGARSFTLRYTLGVDDMGSIPAQEIRVKQGDTVRVRLHTPGGAHHTIHWHGVRLPWAMDGVPDMTQDVGAGTYTYEFVAKDAGTFWYHCHVAAPRHINEGMFGAFIVEPADPTVDPPFDRETTLFLHEYDLASFAASDAAFTMGPGAAENAQQTAPDNPFEVPGYAVQNGAQAYDETMEFGPQGEAVENPQRPYLPRYDTFMINGKVFPDTDPLTISSGETLRIRMVNAGQLTHTMHLHGHRFLVTHKDGALLFAPYLADTLGIFPGERYDLYVLGDNPGHWDFHDHGGGWGIGAYASNGGLFPGGMNAILEYDDWEMPALTGPVPDALRAHATPTSTSGGASSLTGHAAHGASRADEGARAAALPLSLGLLA